jgi:hypothetical protein
MSVKRSELSEESLDALAMMGLALRVVHEIEDYLAQAFVLGITDRERTRSMTVNEYLAQRERMTFGQLVAKLKAAWELDPELEQFLDLFVKRRNLLVHRLTIQKGFDPETKAGANRLRKWLGSFLKLAFVAHRLIRGGWTFSVEAARNLVEKSGAHIPPIEPPEEFLQEAREFLAMAIPRESKTESELAAVEFQTERPNKRMERTRETRRSS